ncbi:hypothetical protein [Kitasatospora sp. NPDC059827]|uniref:hypothetical protein n=1 Tax=Kitasatospora sp. NPDC059827 TaxID=3346964 RepID=UPI00364AED15
MHPKKNALFTRGIRSIASGVAMMVVLVAAGCAGEHSGSAPVATRQSPGADTVPKDGTPGGSTSPAPGGADSLLVKEDPVIGRFLTDGLGNSLYVYDLDSANPPKSACTSDCAQTWLPALASATMKQPAGVTGKVGTLTRDDTTIQLTIAGHPVYRYTKDVMPGDTKGKDATGWSLVGPDGAKAAAPTTDKKSKTPSSRPTDSSANKGTEKPAGRQRLTVVVLPTVGEVLALDGRVLYVNGDGLQVGGGRHCRDSCMAGWQQARSIESSSLRLVVAGTIDVSSVGEILVEDKTHQLTIGGHRVYTYNGDYTAADVNGLGMKGCWWPISSKGLVTGSTPAGK